MNSYKVLNNQLFTQGEYALVPIRSEDRLDIMKWRNEQIYHLRQNKPLTEEDQNSYFENVVATLFEQDQPSQILFSYLHNGKCIGYGGLVHINWIDRNAEISFIMDTSQETEHFEFHWNTYLSVLQKAAFTDLGLHKIYTYAFDLRPRLYSALTKVGFRHEATFTQHCLFHGNYIDVLIHSKINTLNLRKATIDDLESTYRWATDSEVRRYSFSQNSISKEEHHLWFQSKIQSKNCEYLILEDSLNVELGSVRIDQDENRNGIISYLIDPKFHGRGLGKTILALVENYISKNKLEIGSLTGYVMADNIPSLKIFESLGYTKSMENGTLKYSKQLL